MKAFGLYSLAALAEIGGCYAFWLWWRLDKSPLWLLPGVMGLVLFAFLLSLTPAGFAGRAFAAYGGVYIAASLFWLWLVEGQRPLVTDWAGAAVTLLGAAVILYGVRGA